MNIPKAYLTSYKNLKPIIAAIQGAQAPAKFTVRFLESLGFKSPADRLIIPVFKSLGLLNQNGEPTSRYFQFMDPAQAPRVMAESLREAYAGLFQINTKAYELSNNELKNKLKTVSEGQYKDAVLDGGHL